MNFLISTMMGLTTSLLLFLAALLWLLIAFGFSVFDRIEHQILRILRRAEAELTK